MQSSMKQHVVFLGQGKPHNHSRTLYERSSRLPARGDVREYCPLPETKIKSDKPTKKQPSHSKVLRKRQMI